MKKKLSFIIEIIIGIIFICFGYFVIDTDYYATLFYAMGFGLAFASGVQLLKICYYEMPIYIVENGFGYNDQINADGQIIDDYRIDYMRKHLEEMKLAIQEGVDCRGYLSWGPVDILSSRAQMKKRYGFIYVNRENDDLKDMRRIRKKSFAWYQQVIASNGEVL